MVEGAGGRDRVSASAVHIPCCSQVLSRAHVFNCWDLKGCGAPCVPQTHSVASSAAVLVHLPETGRRVEYLVANEARATRVNWTATSGRNKAPSSPQGPCCIGNSRCHGMLACDGAGCSQLWRQEDGYEKQGGGGSCWTATCASFAWLQRAQHSPPALCCDVLAKARGGGGQYEVRTPSAKVGMAKACSEVTLPFRGPTITDLETFSA